MKGFTIVEMVFSCAIVTILLMALYGILGTCNSVYTRSTALLDTEQQARTAMDRMVREIRESKATAITVVNANSHRISFNTPTKTGVQYYLNGANLVREYPLGEAKNVASYISRLNFIQSTVFLTIDVSAQRTLYGRVYSFPLRENVRLRNE